MRRDLHNKKVVVVGAGRSGLALADYFQKCGAAVILSDRREAQRIAGLGALLERDLVLDLGGHTPALFAQADFVVVSPGVSLDLPAVAAARATGIPVYGEVEVAYQELDAPVLGITGTNGKSTTTSLLGAMLQNWGQRTFVGGNLGNPLIEAAGKPWDYLVVELSSFQLEAINAFRPRYAILLNISADHLDRYPDMGSYVAAKCRLFENQREQDVAVLNADDPAVLAATEEVRSRKVYFSSARVLAQGMGFDGENLVWRWQGGEHRFAVAELELKGMHNIENVMAALIPALLEGCPPEIAWQAACDFKGLAHRMVPVRTLNDVTWYNDSKGTNVGSVVKSLAGLQAPVTLIAGGRDKGGDYGALAPMVAEKVAHLILIGEAAPRMEQALGGLSHTVRVNSLEEAVRTASALTAPGGTVLLSPACSSFDMFASFEERGDLFTRAVLGLPGRQEEAI